MSRAGYAEFFPNAPSVVLAKKAEAERAAREKARKAHDDYDRDASGALSAASTSSSATSVLTANSQLTPATSSSSPPDVSPRSTAKDKAAAAEIVHDSARPAIPTPKTTPPAVVKPAERNCRIKYDPFLDKDTSAKKTKQLIYRYDGEGVSTPIQDPRKAVPDYTLGPKTGKKQVRVALARHNWQWDQHYIGPGPPAQIMITGLSALTTESEIQMHFRTFGDVEKFELKMDPTTGGSLGICSIVYRDNKLTKTLGHQAAKHAVHKGNGMKIAMQPIQVVLDRDGLKCAKVVDRLLEEKRRKEEEARKKEEALAARNRPPPPPPPPPPLGPQDRSRGLLPVRRDRSSTRDQDSRFSKPRPPNYRALDDVGARPAVFISTKYIPGEQRLCKHLYGRLKNFGVEDVLADREGFYVIFENIRGLESCFRMCDGDRLFSYPMRMKKLPRGNSNLLPSRSDSRSPSPPPKERKNLERPNVHKATCTHVLEDLKRTLLSDVRKRIAEPHIYDLLDPDRLAKRRKTEENSSSSNTATTISTPLTTLAAATYPTTTPIVPSVTRSGGLAAAITALPRFKKKQKPKRLDTPASDASPMPDSSREITRPLAHRLNHYDLEGSDDESTTTDHHPQSRGSASRALSIDIADDDTASVTTSLTDIRIKKRKRSLGARTPSRLKDTAISTDDEDENAGKALAGAEDEPMEEESGIADQQPETYDDEEEEVGRRKKSKTSAVATEAAGAKIENPKSAEEEIVDVTGLDDAGTEAIQLPPNDKTDVAIDLFLDQIEAERDGPKPVVDMSWTISSTDHPRVTVADDLNVIMDVDGLQAAVMDDEDLLFMKKALKGQEPMIGNIHAWTCKFKERKAANREGKRGVIHTEDKIEGFYRPNPSGCARTEGYRKIPESEKSQYLPHRLAVAAKRANAAVQSSPTQTRTITAKTNKPVSSSRENRVNNRRLVQELNNQKQILCGDADIMRFNQLKKRKKPVRFARSAIHNWGLYAMENIAANDMIIEYVGEIVRQQVADMREKKYIKSGIGSSYLFRIDENTVIDATKKGGIARFINHSCTPNCTAKIIKVEGTKRIVIYALRDIKENEELTYDYKFERELDSDERIPCLCGSSGCKGFLN
ncbi:hypothetical protein FN846DRAFT_717561 [Sphaerosporella brunnea]|uniref:Histone-lysine N-methyltransferase, H3 lysine-4 specific n=1 Tax=Sphaerosporella brunnea TaxID=1250544 RepID=A0A5J5EXF7_9PEZI|nr:hypothetical protein FN846DRAFT_717561 [Sphaerosporella brunnea]